LENQGLALASIFLAVETALQENREALNRCDLVSANHGDNMVDVFQIATRTVAELGSDNLSEAMAGAADQLKKAGDNDIAQIYAHGLAEISDQLRINDVSLQNLIATIKSFLGDDDNGISSHKDSENEARTGIVLKSLLAGLADWNRVEESQEKSDHPLDFGALVGIGMAYMQAKRRNQERIDILADAAASASPLVKDPCHYQSGVIAIKALLQAIQQTSG
jgi:hypothetical protein